MEDPSSDEECVTAIREALKSLVTDGLVPYNVGDNGGFLLKLGLVKAKRDPIDGNASETERHESATRALRAILEAAVEHEDISGKHRRLLRAVLPLKPELVGESIKVRRTEAGKDLKPGKDDVTAGTIRNHYEPKALEKLAIVLWLMELEFRGAATPTHGGQADSAGSNA
jgi:hypothetical protein